MIIRDYQVEDNVAIEQITREAWQKVSMAAMREQRYGQLGNAPWTEQKVRGILARFAAHPECALVAEIEQQVVGYVSYTITLQGYLGVVGDNAVAVGFQKRGIGTALVRAALQRMIDAGVEVLEVSTFAHDVAARRVYERCGFEEMATTVHYTMRPENCILDESAR